MYYDLKWWNNCQSIVKAMLKWLENNQKFHPSTCLRTSEAPFATNKNVPPFNLLAYVILIIQPRARKILTETQKMKSQGLRITFIFTVNFWFGNLFYENAKKALVNFTQILEICQLISSWHVVNNKNVQKSKLNWILTNI